MFANYLDVVLSGSASDCNHNWGIVTSKFLDFVGISFAAITRDNVLLFKTAD